MKVKDAPLKDVLKFGKYSLAWDDHVDEKCNICGATLELPCDVLQHIVDEHLDDELPDVDPGPDGDSGLLKCPGCGRMVEVVDLLNLNGKELCAYCADPDEEEKA
jgi:hypothetical protein